jgi:hypothetical protein
VRSWSYAGGEVSLEVDYTTDLEGCTAAANFSFDPLFVVHSPILLEFTVASNGTLLIVADSSAPSAVSVKYILLGATGLSLLLLLVGSFFKEMVGVELVVTLQTVFFSQFALAKYTPAMASFQELSLVDLSGLFLEKTSLNVKLSPANQKLPFSVP